MLNGKSIGPVLSTGTVLNAFWLGMEWKETQDSNILV